MLYDNLTCDDAPTIPMVIYIMCTLISIHIALPCMLSSCISLSFYILFSFYYHMWQNVTSVSYQLIKEMFYYLLLFKGRYSGIIDASMFVGRIIGG